MSVTYRIDHLNKDGHVAEKSFSITLAEAQSIAECSVSDKYPGYRIIEVTRKDHEKVLAEKPSVSDKPWADDFIMQAIHDLQAMGVELEVNRLFVKSDITYHVKLTMPNRTP